jgi:NAD(P)-dependent dehydrogenase (short-subunit alcohol dehydrogenase family)
MNANDNRIWLITGASSGFGRLLAERVLERGARVAALARTIEPLHALAQRYPGRLECLSVDVRDQASVDAGVAAVSAAFGSIDVLVNNARRGLFAAVEEVSDETLRDIFETNVFGVVRLVRAAAPHLRRSGGGRIIQLSSAVGHATMPFAGLYAATKHAVEALSESLAGEMAPSGIKVSIVEPGYFATNFATSMAFSTPIAHCDGVRTAVMAQWNAMLPGDPAVVVQRILALADAAEPPLRSAVGADALPWIEGSLEQRLQQMRASAGASQDRTLEHA